MVSRVRVTVLTIGLGLVSSACLEKCAPGQVGPGVARLTARNLGSVIQLINADTVCGFESDRVKYDFVVDAGEGQQGCATWQVRDCDLDYTHAEDVSYDCSGAATAVRGRVVVDASRTICGTVTGDPNQPVVPVSPDAVTIAFSRIDFDDFEVVGSTIDAKLTWKRGRLSAVAQPRLAASTSEGICMVPTPHIRLSEVQYEDALVNVIGEGRAFDVPVARSSLTMVNGRHGDLENHLSGEIDVWGSTVDVGGDGLDPDYSGSKFLEGFACTEELALPVSFECKNIAPVLAQGAARLTIRSVGAIANVTEADERCGFSSTAVLESVQLIDGQVGQVGTLRFVTQECAIDLVEPVVTGTSCLGEQTEVSGRVIVTAEKIMHGRLTGNLHEPVVPMDDHPVTITISRAKFEAFHVAGNGQALTQIQGALAAKVTPRVAMDTKLGACASPTPIARIREVTYLEPTGVIIEAPQGRFETVVEAATLDAVNGAWGEDENLLDGRVSLLGETFVLPTNLDDDGLDPEYDPATFAAGWMCGTIDTVNPFACRFDRPLAQGVSQLTAMTLGRVANLLEADTNCGFSSDGVLDDAIITGTLGRSGGSAEFAVSSPCALTFETPTVVDEDCRGTKTFVQGTVRATGTKRLEGYVSGDRLQPIVPTSWDPAQLVVELDFEDFAVWTEPGDNRLDLKSGTLTGTVRPRTAIDKTNGACAKPTPVAMFEGMVYTDAELTITSEGRAFDVAVQRSQLTAINGKRNGRENIIEGTIVMDGEAYAIPVSGDQGLDPNYDPATFDDGFTCDPDLEIPANEAACNMMKPLGEGAARLLIAALGAATHMVNLDDSCGYDDIFVLADPSRVEGEPGNIGLMEWELDRCRPGYGSPYTRDCLGRQSFASGRVTHTGKRTVVGIREDLIVADSIVPNTPNSVTVTHDELVFESFSVSDVDAGESTPARAVTIHEGTMSAVVEPITGRNPDGGFDVRTSVARLRDITVTPMPVTIFFEGKTFEVMIDRAELSAFNGSWEGSPDTNVIEGEIVVDGQLVPIPRQALEPDYDQATFDSRYACIDGLQETVTPSDVPSP